jgi:hypothetical protein
MKTKNNYRKIYEQYHITIPRDKNGRKYDIHHIDGNHDNNSPTNLVALTIEEHYDVHYSQEDWYACFLIGTRMKKSTEELSFLLSGEKNHNFDSTIYYLVHKTGKLFTGTRQDFFKAETTVNHGNFSSMIAGNANSVQGWKLVERVVEKQPPRTGISDSNIYNFVHEDGTVYTGNRRDFIKFYNQNQGKVSQLVNKRIIQTNGWRLMSN